MDGKHPVAIGVTALMETPFSDISCKVASALFPNKGLVWIARYYLLQVAL